MLSPEYLDQLPQSILDLYSQVEIEIIKDIARRISKENYLTPTGLWQTDKLKEIGAIEDDILKRLSEITRKSDEEITKLYMSAVETSLAYDDVIHKEAGKKLIPLAENLALQQIMKVGLKRTKGLFKNLTKTTPNSAGKQLEHILDIAYTKTITGAFSYDAAIKSAIKELCSKGIGSTYYNKTGHFDYIDTVVRRSILTGINNTACEISLARCDEVGCDLVKISAHGGARPDHAKWQGGIFSISGKSKKYPKLSTATGYGSGDGLGGWNCRHSFSPFYEGIDKPLHSDKYLEDLNAKKVTYNGKKYTQYEASQIQRYQERQIKKWKRESNGVYEAGFDNSAELGKVSEWQAKQRSFVKQTGRKRDYTRERAGKQYQ